MELPIYKLIVTDDEEIGVNFVSIVDEPATQSYAAYFKSNEPKEHKFQVFDEEKRLAMGALMVADKPIYRRDDKGREYYVILDAENIDKAMQKFFARGYQNNVNLMHDPTQIAEGVTMYQHFIINREMGIKTPKGFEPLPDGSSFGIYKVNNNEVWEKIKANQFGFSIEGMFKEQPIIMVTPEEVEAVLGALKKASEKII
jgi:hypothetical protein